jgi:membrane-bound ClpP family serine protease
MPRLILVGLILLGALAGLARAQQDTVFLTDGRQYTGRIVDENTVLVEIETKVAGIATRMKIERARISSIVRGHDEWQKEDEVEAVPESEREDPGTKVMEIPLTGTFGREVLPIGFRKSLEHARRNDVSHVVLRVRSPGGYLWASQQILDVMEEYRDRMTFHALVEQSISAAIWPTFACESIHIAPGGSIGGAVAFTVSSTGSAEVDAKMNSVLAAKLVAVAEQYGHSGDVIRAMILMEEELWSETVEERVRLTGSRPSSPQGAVEMIVGASEVLSLTTREAVRYGVADAIESPTLAAIMTSLVIEDWRGVDSGARIMDQWSDECRKRLETVETLRRKLLSLLEEYEEAETYDEAIAALSSFQNEHPRFSRAVRGALECYTADETVEPDEVREMSRRVRELISELREEKRKRP